MITPNTYQEKALRTLMPDVEQANKIINAIEACPRLSQIIVAGAKLSSESGELNDAIVKHISYGQELDEANILEECGDLLWYIAVILRSCGFTMEQAMELNILKLAKRYPEKFTEEHAAKRLDKITSTCKDCGEPEENCKCDAD